MLDRYNAKNAHALDTGGSIPGYTETVELGSPDLARDLKEQFDIPKPFDLDLATTIVPVVTVDLTDENDTAPGENAFYAGATITPAAGQFPMVRLTNTGTSTIVVDTVRINHVNQVAITLSRPALTADNAVSVLYTGSIPAAPRLTVRGQSAAGGLNADIPVHFTADPEGTVNHDLGVVLYPGVDLLFFGSSAASFLGIAVWGREYD